MKSSGNLNSRERILELAAVMFAERGKAGVSMRDVAKAVNMTPAALYHHFDGKSSLYSAALENVFREKTSPVRHIAASDCLPEQKLEDIMTYLARLLFEDEVFAQLLRRELVEGDEVRLRFLTHELLQDVFDEVAAVMREVIGDHDPFRFSLFAISLIFGFAELRVISRHLSGGQFDIDAPEHAARECMRLLLGRSGAIS